jgi:hypothetical protein
MNLSGTMTNGICQPVRLKEDFRLLTGRGSFADDVSPPGLAHAVIVRSPMPMRTSHLSTKRQRLPRYYKFESISLQRRVHREPGFRDRTRALTSRSAPE